jgi:hypothetical protein
MTQPYIRGSLINDSEWGLVIETLRKHGPDSAKAVLVRGQQNADGRPARSRTLYDLLHRDPLKRQEWEDAEREFLTQFVQVMHESALTPEVIKDYDKKTGKLIRERVSRRDMNWAALMVLRRYDAKWRDRKAVEVNGQIQHEHAHMLGAPTGFVLNPEEIALLPEHKARQLLELLYEVEEAKHGQREFIEQPTAAQLPATQQQSNTDSNEATIEDGVDPG